MAVTIGTPAIKVIIIVAVALQISVQFVRTTKGADFVCMDRISRAAAGHLAFAAADFNDSGVSVVVDIELVRSRTKDGKRQIGGVHLESFVFIQALYPDSERACCEPEL